ncbi:MAG: NADP-dependent oxidoreductase [Armatimonadetes bacterium]|nr:NADP-dependent oxidoreductase [Armatimonadota bacterium]
MQAAVIHRFGSVENIVVQTLPVPEVRSGEVLIKVEVAGIGSWDAEEREGEYAEYLGVPEFPYCLGWDGAGVVAAVGAGVDRFNIGDPVYATVFPGSRGGGFYAEYVTVEAEYVSSVPDGLTLTQAGVMGWDVLTARSGIEDVLNVKPGESLMIFGASGGIGHMAVQLAKRLGVRVLAIASGDDGVALARQLGADAVVNGRKDDVVAVAREFAPAGLDAALVTAGGEAVEKALDAVRDGGRIAYPNGVTPPPKPRPGIHISSYDASRGAEATAKLHRLIAVAPFEVHVAHTFPIKEVAEAHRALGEHYLGKLALRLSAE